MAGWQGIDRLIVEVLAVGEGAAFALSGGAIGHDGRAVAEPFRSTCALSGFLAKQWAWLRRKPRPLADIIT